MQATLSFRQERFVFEYLKDQNASAAAARAGYTAKNMASQGNELMSNPAVRERVRLEMQDLLAELRCSALELMKQRARAAFFRAEKLFAQGWEPLALEDLDEETRQAVEVSTVLRKSGPVVRVKQPDRHKALRALEKVHERLERLNEQYYAQARREGSFLSLEEIERMDPEVPETGTETAPRMAADAAAETAPQMAAETAPETAREAAPEITPEAAMATAWATAAPTPALDISQKPQVFSGSGQEAGLAALQFAGKPHVLSGSAASAAEAEPALLTE